MFHLLHEAMRDHKMLWYWELPGLQLHFSMPGAPILSTGPFLGTGKMWQTSLQLLRLETHLISTWCWEQSTDLVGSEWGDIINHTKGEIWGPECTTLLSDMTLTPQRLLNTIWEPGKICQHISNSTRHRSAGAEMLPRVQSSLEEGAPWSMGASLHLCQILGRKDSRNELTAVVLIRKLSLVASLSLSQFCSSHLSAQGHVAVLSWFGCVLVAHGPCDPQFLCLHSQGHKRPLNT